VIHCGSVSEVRRVEVLVNGEQEKHRRVGEGDAGAIGPEKVTLRNNDMFSDAPSMIPSIDFVPWP